MAAQLVADRIGVQSAVRSNRCITSGDTVQAASAGDQPFRRFSWPAPAPAPAPQAAAAGLAGGIMPGIDEAAAARQP
jgi:hypothetical protein